MSDADQETAAPEPSEAPFAPPDSSVCTMAMLCHLLALVSLIGPLIIWLLKREDHPLIDDQGKESLNFQITMTLAAFVSTVLICAGGIGLVLLPIVGVVNLVFIIIASIKAYAGEAYRYPFALRLIK